ncbi:MAG: sulfite exporter TauE/SafE family protein [Pyramidobacter sp.]|nr:sulfite exporter TauE/SafE family protein [Pyramidobacter sp.]MBP3751012.1 sulfite exporter TauE/SafE family protein [Pyramidobacter sp.]MBP3835709.1 sulfite exporter TauE/SafE family protein [Pyramidobacter sp.]MBQ4491571.1 sulfite exporter TauE/SafE family protein [Pyramidobacter sp.]MBQ9423721.1 sulfite exporter TauE/SafE family protein [Pyramidobacter sp.]
MEFSVIAAMLASTVAGGVVASVCGFGFGVVVMAIWPYFLPYAQSVAVSALCGVSTAVMIAIPHWKHINFKTLLPCALSGLIASALSVHFSAGAADKLMIHALGWVLIAVSIYNVFLGGKIRIKATPRNGVIAGLIGGTGAGLFSVGGPPVAIYMLASAHDNQEYRATLNAHFCFTSGVATIARAANGIITPTTLKLWLMVLAALALGLFLGNKIFNRLDAKKLRMAVYGYLLISGLTMILK